MASPEDHLPKPITHDAINSLLASLGLPKATEIVAPNVTAAYHAIYLITVPENDKSRPHTELVLRVSGNHIPAIKTKNEVGIMTWVARNTKTPVPEIIAYDASTSNPIGHEFTLLSRATGKTLSDVYSLLSEADLDSILDQVIDILVDLHSHDWHHIGGLNLDAEGKAMPARVVDETFWQAGDLGLWPQGETVESLNVAGPYTSWTETTAAYVQHYIRLIRIHEKLAFMRDSIPRLQAFTEKIAEPGTAPALNARSESRFVLAHKDLHFANLLYENGHISAVLDWEFSEIVPSPLWNPRKAFLWNGQPGSESLVEKRRLVARFEDRVRARGDARTTKLLLDGQNYASPQQEAMQRVVDYLRAITEVAPRGGREEVLPGWKNTVLENLAKFDV